MVIILTVNHHYLEKFLKCFFFHNLKSSHKNTFKKYFINFLIYLIIKNTTRIFTFFEKVVTKVVYQNNCTEVPL